MPARPLLGPQSGHHRYRCTLPLGPPRSRQRPVQPRATAGLESRGGTAGTRRRTGRAASSALGVHSQRINTTSSSERRSRRDDPVAMASCRACTAFVRELSSASPSASLTVPTCRAMSLTWRASERRALGSAIPGYACVGRWSKASTAVHKSKASPRAAVELSLPPRMRAARAAPQRKSAAFDSSKWRT